MPKISIKDADGGFAISPLGYKIVFYSMWNNGLSVIDLTLMKETFCIKKNSDRYSSVTFEDENSIEILYKKGGDGSYYSETMMLK